jgi:hypothetical protein
MAEKNMAATTDRFERKLVWMVFLLSSTIVVD